MDDTDIRLSRRTFGILFLIILNLFPVYLTLRIMQWVPLQRLMLAEMGLGESIPGITSLVFATYRFFWILPLVSIALTLVAARRRCSSRLLPAATVAATFGVTFVLLWLFVDSALLPILYVMEKLGA